MADRINMQTKISNLIHFKLKHKPNSVKLNLLFSVFADMLIIEICNSNYEVSHFPRNRRPLALNKMQFSKPNKFSILILTNVLAHVH